MMRQIRIHKPVTPGQRERVSYVNKTAEKIPPERTLLKMIRRSSGRAHGRVTVRHKGGRAKIYYRLIDFKRDKTSVLGRVASVEYDPNRNTEIALINYSDGEKRYILAPEDLEVGDTVQSGEAVPIKAGNSLPLIKIPPGTLIHNLEVNRGQGGILVRSAGGAAQLLSREEDGRYVRVKMPSGEIRRFLSGNYATVGQLSKVAFRQAKLGKAGRSRYLGIRPTVRGDAQNPSSHPHGGGEGRSGIGMPSPKTPWGKRTMGRKTRRRMRTNKYIISKSRR